VRAPEPESRLADRAAGGGRMVGGTTGAGVRVWTGRRRNISAHAADRGRDSMVRKTAATALAVAALALVPALAHAQQEERKSEVVIASVIDASVKNADLLADGMKDQAKLAEVVGGRDVKVVAVHELLDDPEERMLADTIDASTVLSSNRLLARNAVMTNEHLAQAARDNNVSPERVVAVDVMTLPESAVTLYVLDVPELSSPPTVPGPTGTR
jgi:hypothetical protein